MHREVNSFFKCILSIAMFILMGFIFIYSANIQNVFKISLFGIHWTLIIVHCVQMCVMGREKL